MRTMHIDIHRLENGDLHERIDPRAIQQTGDVEGDGTRIKCQQVGVFHQRTAALQELFTHLGRRLLVPAGEEPLETGGTTFLTLTVVRIIIIEQTREQRTLGQLFVDGTLLTVIIQLTTLLS